MSILDDNAIYRVGEIAIWDWLSKYTHLNKGEFKLYKENNKYAIDVKSTQGFQNCQLNIISDVPTDLFSFKEIEGDVQLKNVTNVQGSPEFIAGTLYVYSDDLKQINTWGTKGVGRIIMSCDNLIDIKELPCVGNLGVFEMMSLQSLPEIFTGETFEALKCPNLKNLPQFRKEIYGYIDISGCWSLPVSEFKKLPDKVSGNVYMQGLPDWELYFDYNESPHKIRSRVSDKVLISTGECYF